MEDVVSQFMGMEDPSQLFPKKKEGYEDEALAPQQERNEEQRELQQEQGSGFDAQQERRDEQREQREQQEKQPASLISGSESVEVRYFISKYSNVSGKPLIQSALYGFKINPSDPMLYEESLRNKVDSLYKTLSEAYRECVVDLVYILYNDNMLKKIGLGKDFIKDKRSKVSTRFLVKMRDVGISDIAIYRLYDNLSKSIIAEMVPRYTEDQISRESDRKRAEIMRRENIQKYEFLNSVYNETKQYVSSDIKEGVEEYVPIYDSIVQLENAFANKLREEKEYNRVERSSDRYEYAQEELKRLGREMVSIANNLKRQVDSLRGIGISVNIRDDIYKQYNTLSKLEPVSDESQTGQAATQVGAATLGAAVQPAQDTRFQDTRTQPLFVPKNVPRGPDMTASRGIVVPKPEGGGIRKALIEGGVGVVPLVPLVPLTQIGQPVKKGSDAIIEKPKLVEQLPPKLVEVKTVSGVKPFQAPIVMKEEKNVFPKQQVREAELPRTPSSLTAVSQQKSADDIVVCTRGDINMISNIDQSESASGKDIQKLKAELSQSTNQVYILTQSVEDKYSKYKTSYERGDPQGTINLAMQNYKSEQKRLDDEKARNDDLKSKVEFSELYPSMYKAMRDSMCARGIESLGDRDAIIKYIGLKSYHSLIYNYFKYKERVASEPGTYAQMYVSTVKSLTETFFKEATSGGSSIAGDRSELVKLFVNTIVSDGDDVWKKVSSLIDHMRYKYRVQVGSRESALKNIQFQQINNPYIVDDVYYNARYELYGIFTKYFDDSFNIKDLDAYVQYVLPDPVKKPVRETYTTPVGTTNIQPVLIGNDEMRFFTMSYRRKTMRHLINTVYWKDDIKFNSSKNVFGNCGIVKNVSISNVDKQMYEVVVPYVENKQYSVTARYMLSFLKINNLRKTVNVTLKAHALIRDLFVRNILVTVCPVHLYKIMSDCADKGIDGMCLAVVSESPETDLRLSDWISEPKNPAEIASIYFNIFYTLYALRMYYNVSYSDLSSNDIYLRKVQDCGYWKFSILGKVYMCPNYGYMPLVCKISGIENSYDKISRSMFDDDEKYTKYGSGTTSVEFLSFRILCDEVVASNMWPLLKNVNVSSVFRMKNVSKWEDIFSKFSPFLEENMSVNVSEINIIGEYPGKSSPKYSQNGYNSDMIDMYGFDMYGVSKNGNVTKHGFISYTSNIIGNVLNAGGFDAFGFDAQGFNIDGYDIHGYNSEGYDRRGYDSKGYDKDGYNIEGYDKKGYDREGYDKSGHDRKGYDRMGYDKNGYDKDGYNPIGLDQKGYDRDGYNINGYDAYGFDKLGKSANGFYVDGYGDTGYDIDGYDRAGYDRNGYDKLGVDIDGYDRNGYNAQGFNRNGYNAYGRDKWGMQAGEYADGGYSSSGYNHEGYDRQGYDRSGYNKEGRNKDNRERIYVIRSGSKK